MFLFIVDLCRWKMLCTIISTEKLEIPNSRTCFFKIFNYIECGVKLKNTSIAGFKTVLLVAIYKPLAETIVVFTNRGKFNKIQTIWKLNI